MLTFAVALRLQHEALAGVNKATKVSRYVSATILMIKTFQSGYCIPGCEQHLLMVYCVLYTFSIVLLCLVNSCSNIFLVGIVGGGECLSVFFSSSYSPGIA